MICTYGGRGGGGGGGVFFFNDTATTEIYTLSLHDALPISLSHYVFTDRPIYNDIRASFPLLT